MITEEARWIIRKHSRAMAFQLRQLKACERYEGEEYGEAAGDYPYDPDSDPFFLVRISRCVVQDLVAEHEEHS